MRRESRTDAKQKTRGGSNGARKARCELMSGVERRIGGERTSCATFGVAVEAVGQMEDIRGEK